MALGPEPGRHGPARRRTTRAKRPPSASPYTQVAVSRPTVLWMPRLTRTGSAAIPRRVRVLERDRLADRGLADRVGEHERDQSAREPGEEPAAEEAAHHRVSGRGRRAGAGRRAGTRAGSGSRRSTSRPPRGRRGTAGRRAGRPRRRSSGRRREAGRPGSRSPRTLVTGNACLHERDPNRVGCAVWPATA